MPCWHCHYCRSMRATGLSSRWKCLWLYSSSLTRADHILTRSPSGEIESDKSQNGVRNVAESVPPACLSWQLVSHSTTASSTGKKLGCDTMAGSDDLAFLPVFGLHRNNSTLLSSDLCDILITKKQSRTPTMRNCGMSPLHRNPIWLD